MLDGVFEDYFCNFRLIYPFDCEFIDVFKLLSGLFYAFKFLLDLVSVSFFFSILEFTFLNESLLRGLMLLLIVSFYGAPLSPGKDGLT